MRTYTLEDPKPKFKQGECVAIDTSHLGLKIGILPGTVVGRGMENVIDFWIIQFNRTFGPDYPYNTLLIMHTAIVKE